MAGIRMGSVQAGTQVGPKGGIFHAGPTGLRVSGPAPADHTKAAAKASRDASGTQSIRKHETAKAAHLVAAASHASAGNAKEAAFHEKKAAKHGEEAGVIASKREGAAAPTPVAPARAPAPPPPPAPAPKPAAVTSAVTTPKAAAPPAVTGQKTHDAAKQYAHLSAKEQAALRDGGFDALLQKHPATFEPTQRVGGGGLYMDGKVSHAAKTPNVKFGVTDSTQSTITASGQQAISAKASLSHEYVLIHETSHHLHFTLAERVRVESGYVPTAKDMVLHHDGNARSDLVHGGDHVDRSKFEHTEGGKLLVRVQDAHQKTVYAGAVSKYAKTDPAEWFAETHAAYVQSKSQLKSARPLEYALMRDVRKYMGMPE